MTWPATEPCPACGHEGTYNAWVYQFDHVYPEGNLGCTAQIIRREDGSYRITGAPTAPTELYRFFDAAGQLLYIGISFSAIQRASQHRAEKQWWRDVVGMTVERHTTRALALDAERAAIITEKPLHNVVHNRGPVEEHGRLAGKVYFACVVAGRQLFGDVLDCTTSGYRVLSWSEHARRPERIEHIACVDIAEWQTFHTARQLRKVMDAHFGPLVPR